MLYATDNSNRLRDSFCPQSCCAIPNDAQLTTPALGTVSICMTFADCVKSKIAIHRLTACHWQVALCLSLPFTEEEEIGSEAVEEEHKAKFDSAYAMMALLPLKESKGMTARAYAEVANGVFNKMAL